MSANNGGPAFPTGLVGKVELAGSMYAGAHVPEYKAAANGMSLRDYFAAKAMQGICANSRFNPSRQIGTMASESYLIADAMLEAREGIE